MISVHVGAIGTLVVPVTVGSSLFLKVHFWVLSKFG